MKNKSDKSGELHLTKKLYKAAKASRLIQIASLSQPLSINLTAIPHCIDNLPESVDLSILECTPRQHPVPVSLGSMYFPGLTYLKILELATSQLNE